MRKSRRVSIKTPTKETSKATKTKGEEKAKEKKVEEVKEKESEKDKVEQTEAPKRVVWKPDIKIIAKRIVEQGKINQIHKYFDRYEVDDEILIEDMVIDHMLMYKKNLIELDGRIPQSLYDRL